MILYHLSRLKPTHPFGCVAAFDTGTGKFGIMCHMFTSCLLLAALLTNCAEVANRVFARQTGDGFDLTGQVQVIDNNSDPILNITDETGSTGVMGVRHVIMPLPFKSGDNIHVTGIINVPPDKPTHLPCAICRSASLVATGVPPPPDKVSTSDILSGRYDCRLVRLGGRIRRVIRDEIDTTYIYMQILDNNNIVYLTMRIGEDASLETKLRSLIDAKVEAAGICRPSAYIRRRFIGYTVTISNLKDITVLEPAPDDPYSVPLLDINMVTDVSAINRLGRRRIVGTVLALCSGRRVILKTDSGDIHDVHLFDSPVPSCGARIEAVGIPEADYYQVNLVDSTWRKASGAPMPTVSPVGVTLERLLTDGKGHEQINPNFHGNVIRTTGTLIDIPTKESSRDFAILGDKGGTILLDIASARQMLDSVSVGCKISVSGVCTVNREPAMAPQRFQRANGVTLVVRSPDDMEVLERPPWWTPIRLMAVVGVLLLAVVGFFIWNRILQRVINHKSRQLLRENIANIKASLRIDERTNLAVELHDSLSQNLSGVACQIAATKGTLRDGSDETARYLATAEKMLSSCRTELRRCLWDLRENALDENDFAAAIRKTLAPVAIGVETQIRFDVPRNYVNDRTAHSILCIIRELVSNAIQHGKANALRIDGELEAHSLLFTVSDDGCGFAPDAAVGANEGHFGIEGIRERVKRLGGRFTLKSSPGNGCIATAIIPLSTIH